MLYYIYYSIAKNIYAYKNSPHHLLFGCLIRLDDLYFVERVQSILNTSAIAYTVVERVSFL